MKKTFLPLLIGLTLSLPALAEMPAYQLKIKDHRYQPAELKIPANQRVKITVDNQDATAEEFEGEDFHLEKVIPGNSQATIMVGPFAPGKYEFVGEFHEDTAKGVLIVE